ncbi:chitin synthase [Plakobranchus ocellatus]|uniref:Chitin synthase n=1 Tax=Plakobranchus ocellatus TaxID=259542 RepID=A0AAV4E0V8_9GAST|nr:chitin synthase [Plakobranchus ocellatus]
MFVHIPRIDNQGHLSFQPLGLIFLSCFSIILLMQFLGMFLHRWGTFLHTLSITNIGIGSHQKEQEKVKEIIIRVSELQKLRNIEMEPEPDYDEPLPDYLDDENLDRGSCVSVEDGPRIEDPPPDYSDDPDVGITRPPPVAKKPRYRTHFDDILSVPPSYHTDEGKLFGHHRRDVLDRHGNLSAFALENAFERRLRNTLQRRRPRYQQQNIPTFSSPFDAYYRPPMRSHYTHTAEQDGQDYTIYEQQRHQQQQQQQQQHQYHHQQQQQYPHLERNQFTQGHSPSHLHGRTTRDGVKGATRF